jgi:hypothetical protein
MIVLLGLALLPLQVEVREESKILLKMISEENMSNIFKEMIKRTMIKIAKINLMSKLVLKILYQALSQTTKIVSFQKIIRNFSVSSKINLIILLLLIKTLLKIK